MIMREEEEEEEKEGNITACMLLVHHLLGMDTIYNVLHKKQILLNTFEFDRNDQRLPPISPSPTNKQAEHLF